MTCAFLSAFLLASCALHIPSSGRPSRDSGSDTLRLTRGGALRHAALLLGGALLPPPSASAEEVGVAAKMGDPVVIGQIPASGIIFKDIVKVERIEDPKVRPHAPCRSPPPPWPLLV